MVNKLNPVSTIITPSLPNDVASQLTLKARNYIRSKRQARAGRLMSGQGSVLAAYRALGGVGVGLTPDETVAVVYELFGKKITKRHVYNARRYMRKKGMMDAHDSRAYLTRS